MDPPITISNPEIDTKIHPEENQKIGPYPKNSQTQIRQTPTNSHNEIDNTKNQPRHKQDRPNLSQPDTKI